MARLKNRRSILEMLPPAADPAIAWALSARQEGRLPQADVLNGLNERLKAAGVKVEISKSAFSRFYNHVADGTVPNRFLDRTRPTSTDELLVKLIDERIQSALDRLGLGSRRVEAD